eukprot:TRINITY_DN405_c0_g1_i1.p1 TRINITY_DN405_c0_g1~~TRINITY_DN405_c0_g1_i1.p1  ORF type:complete len:619 (-),score=278.33 TRINITY_DN405_c0_g1_i1:113-1969(-)
MATPSQAAIALLMLSSVAALPSCQFQVPNYIYNGSQVGCNAYDVSSLPNANWFMKDSIGYHYVVNSPCNTVLNATGVCTNGDSDPLVPAPAYQFYDKTMCIALGNLTQVAIAGDQYGVYITYYGGQGNPSCDTRIITYNILCDPTAPPNAGPANISNPATCAYDVFWPSPAGCPTYQPYCGQPAPQPVPTPSQLRYETNEIAALIHFNMATFFQDGDPGCTKNNWLGVNGSSNPGSFAPSNLNFSNWAVSFQAIGAKHAILTAKHGCGHLLWPSKVQLPNGTVYWYAVGGPNSYIKQDVLANFVAMCDTIGIGHGFYYSLTNNFFLNVHTHQVQPGPLLPGQVNVTQAEFEAIALGHLTELWSDYGQLTEIWFDGGYTSDMADEITALLSKLQPHAAAFNGLGVSANPIRWIGTESGLDTDPVWSTGNGDGNGDPDSPIWNPAGCDTTLQQGDHWFYSQGDPVRPLSELIQVYHSTVGNNGVLELDFAIDRTGNVDPVHAAAYAAFGDWIRGCYGSPIASTSGNGAQLILSLPPGTKLDRIAIREDQAQGQRIRQYTVSYDNGSGSWLPFSKGTSVGNRRIDLGAAAVTTNRLQLVVSNSTAVPVITFFAAYAPCPSS